MVILEHQLRLNVNADSFRVSLVIGRGGGMHGIRVKCFHAFMISRHTLGCSHWWDFFTKFYCCQDVVLPASIMNQHIFCNILPFQN